MRSYEVIARNIEPAADNKIHDDDVAQSFGFTGALVPGVELFAYLTAPLVQAWGLPWLSGGRVDVRFRRPVYDGEQITVAGDPTALQVLGPDHTVRAVGSAEAANPLPAARQPAARELPVTALPARPRPLAQVRPGPLGTVELAVSVADNQAYLEAICEPSSLYRQHSLAHPGGLLRLVNLVLMRNVELGPWIHTASNCRLLAPAQLPATLSVRAHVTDTFVRNGSSYVRYDAVVRCGQLPVLEVAHTAIYRLASTPSSTD